MERKVYLLKIGEVEDFVIEFLEKNLKDVYPFVFVSKEVELNLDSAYNPIRRQFLSTPILLQLDKNKPKDAFMVLGIIDHDIYANGLNFIFGEAELAKKIAIISIKRLREDFYGKRENSLLLKVRALKEAVHELGHLFGISHCSNPLCVMFFSNSLLDTDRKLYKFCNSCRSKVEKLFK
ncbi:MAG: archaemetzincin family Zn-dependent metalloprotease [Candidatus Aminicenantia bacterium]